MTLPTHIDTLIVGAGPIGLACAISARRRRVETAVVDAGAIAESITRYPVGMTFFTTSERLEIGDHPLSSVGPKATREEALSYYRGVARAEQLAVHPFVRLTGATRDDQGIAAHVATRTGSALVRCQRLVLATGYFDHPNLLNVPGEDLPHVSHWFEEAHRVAGQRVVVVGGKNSAIEAALQSWRAGAHVTLVHRGATLPESVKYWLRPDFDNRVAAGEIIAHFQSQIREITAASVHITGSAGDDTVIPADRIFLLTGYHPDFGLLQSIGINIDLESGKPDIDTETLETNVPGVYLAGSAAAGRTISQVFIENGRFDGEKIFGDAASRQAAEARYATSLRPTGE